MVWCSSRYLNVEDHVEGQKYFIFWLLDLALKVGEVGDSLKPHKARDLREVDSSLSPKQWTVFSTDSRLETTSSSAFKISADKSQNRKQVKTSENRRF